jgi:hypothetical protein
MVRRLNVLLKSAPEANEAAAAAAAAASRCKRGFIERLVSSLVGLRGGAWGP